MAKRGRNGSRSCVFPIFDILSRPRDIRDQSRGPNFACFWPPKFFRGGPPEFLDGYYLIGVDSDHVVKFRGDRPTELGDPVSDLKKTSRLKQKAFGTNVPGGLTTNMGQSPT